MIRAGADGKGIVWLASYPKSGNTWLRVFLYQLVRIHNRAPREPDEINHLNRVSMYEARLYGLFQEFLGKPVEDATVEEVAAMRPAVQAAIKDRPPGIALVKTHNCVGAVAGHPVINPAVTAGAVYLARDPRDVVLSLSHHLGVTVDETITIMGADGFSTGNTPDGPYEVWGSWSDHVRSWTERPNDALLVVRYEDLIADPVAQFSRVVAHLRMPGSSAQIAEAAELSTFNELAAAEQTTPFNERSERADRFFREGRAGAWREQLTPNQALSIVAAHGAQMRRMGYGPD